MKKKILKIITDILMLAALIMLLATMRHNLRLHTIAGFAFIFLIVIHAFLNIKWITGITKIFMNVKDKIKRQYIVAVALSIMWIIAVVFAVLILLNTSGGSDSLTGLKRAHGIIGAIACALTFIHIIQHRNRIAALLKRKNKISDV